MIADTISHADTEELLRSLPNDARISYRIGYTGQGQFNADCYEPNDVLRGTPCYGNGSTIAEAIADMLVKIEQAKEKGKKLKTAAECKAAVIELIQQHDAAPASFRDAVDGLNVA